MGRDKKRRFKPNKKHIFGLQISQRLKNEETAPLQPNQETSTTKDTAALVGTNHF
jgi:hypothetical protein